MARLEGSFPGVFSRGGRADVSIRLKLENGNLVRRELAAVGRASMKMSQQMGVPIGTSVTAVRTLRQSFGGMLRDLFDLRAVIATVGKALISGFAITAVFGAMFLALSAIRGVFRGIATALRDIVGSLAEFQESVLSTQAILATTVKFSEELGENFRLAGNVARDMQIELLKRTKEIFVSAKDVGLVIQVLLGTGATKLVKDFQSMVDLAILLTNAIAAVTPGQQLERQLASETAAIMNEMARAQDRLARILGVSTDRFKALRKEAAESGRFVEFMREQLQGINQASALFGSQLTGILTSFSDLATIIKIDVFTPFFDTFLNALIKVRDFMSENIKQIALALAPLGALLDVLLTGIIRRFAPEMEGFINKLGVLVDILATRIMQLVNNIKFFIDVIPRLFATVPGQMDIPKILGFGPPALIEPGPLATEVQLTQKTFEIRTSILKSMASQDSLQQQINNRLVEENEELKKFLAALEKFRTTVARASIQAFESINQQFIMTMRDSLSTVGQLVFDMDQMIAKAISDILDPELRRVAIDRIIQMFGMRLDKLNEAILQSTQELLRKTITGQFPPGFVLPTPPVSLITRARNLLRRFRLEREGVLLPIVDDESIGRMLELRRLLSEQVNILEDASRATGELDEDFDNFVTTIAAINLELSRMADLLVNLSDVLFVRLKARLIELILSGADFGKTFAAALVGSFQVIVASLGRGLAGIITDLFSGAGDDALANFGRFVGSILIQLGSAFIAMGTASLLASLIPFLAPLFNPPAAVGLIAAGAAMVALGAAMGGAGVRGAAGAGVGVGGEAEKVPTFSFEQAQINVQQSMMAATDNLVLATDNLSRAQENLDTMPAGMVFKKGAKEEGGLLTVVDREAKTGSNLTAARSLALTLRGGSS